MRRGHGTAGRRQLHCSKPAPVHWGGLRRFGEWGVAGGQMCVDPLPSRDSLLTVVQQLVLPVLAIGAVGNGVTVGVAAPVSTTIASPGPVPAPRGPPAAA